MATRLQLDEAGTLLADPDTYATVIHAILLAAFESDIYHLDPLEIYAQVNDKFRVQMPEENENKMNAILFAVSTDGFFEDPVIFKSVASALFYGDIGGEVDSEMNELTMPEVAWALFEVGINRDDSPELEPAVAAAIAGIASQEAATGENGDPTTHVVEVLSHKKEELVRQFELIGVPRSELHVDMH